MNAQEAYNAWHMYAAHYNRWSDQPSFDWALISARNLRTWLTDGIVPHWTEADQQMFAAWCRAYNEVL